MTDFHIRHATTYHYTRPVSFGEHRLIIRPRDSHALRLVSATLTIEPAAKVKWSFDIFGNSIARAIFAAPANTMHIVSELILQRFAGIESGWEIAPNARLYPFGYSQSEQIDLGGSHYCQYGDPQGNLSAFARSFITSPGMPTIDLLRAINAHIRANFSYFRRADEGTQAPLDTMARRTGTCRDFAMLMIEMVRALGMGARFVTGYLYVPARDNGQDNGVVGGGATHAWLEVYLPGAGWIEFDPTNGIESSNDLIRVAVTRDASQAIPISGSFTGNPSDFISLEVSVNVEQMAEGLCGR